MSAPGRMLFICAPVDRFASKRGEEHIQARAWDVFLRETGGLGARCRVAVVARHATRLIGSVLRPGARL